jgi:hypothetical protein
MSQLGFTSAMPRRRLSCSRAFASVLELRQLTALVHESWEPVWIDFGGLLMLRRQFCCPDFGGVDGYRSRRRNSLEKYFLPSDVLQPEHWAHWYRRSYYFMMAAVPQRRTRTASRPAAA